MNFPSLEMSNRFRKHLKINSILNLTDPHGELKGVNVLTAVGTDRSGIMADFGIASEAELDEYLERARKVSNNITHSISLSSYVELHRLLFVLLAGALRGAVKEATAASRRQDPDLVERPHDLGAVPRWGRQG